MDTFDVTFHEPFLGLTVEHDVIGRLMVKTATGENSDVTGIGDAVCAIEGDEVCAIQAQLEFDSLMDVFHAYPARPLTVTLKHALKASNKVPTPSSSY